MRLSIGIQSRDLRRSVYEGACRDERRYPMKAFLLSAISVVILRLGVAFVSRANLLVAVPVAFLAFVALTYYLLAKLGKDRQNKTVVIGIVAGLLVTYLEVIIGSITSRPQLIWIPMGATFLLAILSGYCLWRFRSFTKFIPLAASSATVVFVVFAGYAYWLNYLTFGTFTGRISAYKLFQNIEGHDRSKQSVTNNDLAGKVAVLDFWNTSCGVCFEKFPSLEKYYRQHRDSDAVVVYAIDKPIDEDGPTGAFDAIAKEGYTFPVLLPSDPDLPEKFGVTAYPTTVVIDQMGNVVYRGTIEGATELADALAQKGALQ